MSSPPAPASAVLNRPRARRKKITSKTLSLYVLVLPAVVLLIMFNYAPIYGILISFKDFTPYLGIFGSPWVGLRHFAFFLTDDKFWSVMKNTLVISGLDIVFGFPAPIIFALLANEIYARRFKRVMQTISYLPHFISWIVVAGIFTQLLSPNDGLVNRLLSSAFGMEPINFLTKRDWFRPLVVSIEIWKNVGWGAILYFATLAGIDSSLYEAAYIDGAGRWRMAFSVTLPGLLPMIVLMLIFRLSAVFSVGFERIFVFSTPLVYEVSDVISVYTYRLGLVQAQYSLTSAIGLTQSIIGFIMLFTANKLSGKLAGLGLW